MRQPFSGQQERVFIKTLSLASLIGCGFFVMLAWWHGYDILVPALCLVSAAIATALAFSIFGKETDA